MNGGERIVGIPQECGSRTTTGVSIGDLVGNRNLTLESLSAADSVDDMFEPIRGGTRGGQAEFKWSDVSADKDREHYLGHSINAPTGRWQKNKDIHWYNREKKGTEAEWAEEIRKIKEAEADALSVALGFGPTGANATQLKAGPLTGTSAAAVPSAEGDEVRKQEKEERRRRKAERKEERRARKEARRAGHNEHDDGTRYRDRSRSRSPTHRRHADEGDRRSRSWSPTRDREQRLSRLKDYDGIERERERERHRRLWDMNAVRDRPRYRND